MTVLDPRLLPLLETLSSVGADWLAFEIVDGVRRGRETLEPEELLQAAREKVRSRQLSERMSADIPVLAEPILGDDQIAWAANYVADRLDSALVDLDEGCSMIEAVAENSSGAIRRGGTVPSMVEPHNPVKITLIGQEEYHVDRDSISVAREEMLSLRDALTRWSLGAQGKAFL